MASKVQWCPLSEEIKEDLLKDFHKDSHIITSSVSVPGEVWMNSNIAEVAERIYNFELREDDVWVVTFPKCGTTWTQELIWLIMHDADFESVKPFVWARSPFLEWSTLLTDDRRRNILGQFSPDEKEKWGGAVLDPIEYANQMASPRLIKSHLPLFMLPPKLLDTCKVVYVCRNPKDVCVSYYYHTDLMGSNKFKGDFSAFAKRFMQGHIEYGNYWTHLKDAFNRKGHPNLKIVWYEDLKKNMIDVIRHLTTFLDRHLTELRILQIDDFLQIDHYRAFRSEHPVRSQGAKRFFRKGIVGDWRNHFDESTSKAWNEWMKANLNGVSKDFQLSIQCLLD